MEYAGDKATREASRQCSCLDFEGETRSHGKNRASSSFTSGEKRSSHDSRTARSVDDEEYK
jgi:hypothetical protein